MTIEEMLFEIQENYLVGRAYFTLRFFESDHGLKTHIEARYKGKYLFDVVSSSLEGGVKLILETCKEKGQEFFIEKIKAILDADPSVVWHEWMEPKP